MHLNPDIAFDLDRTIAFQDDRADVLRCERLPTTSGNDADCLPQLATKLQTRS
jgi:hypothetical protein